MRRAVPIARLGGPLVAPQGLSAAEATERRERFGRNDIVEVVRRPWRDLLRDTVKDPMIWFLAGTATLYAALGDHVEAGTLLLALVPLVAMDAFLHRRTQASTEGLSHRLATGATVVRDGQSQAIPAGDLVPGDLAIVLAGQPFPADGILTGGEWMQADESILTGEAYPVAKAPLAALPDGVAEPIVDGVHWGYAGTRLLTGRSRLRVVFTGGETLYGEIVRSAVGGARARTPLQKAVASLVSVLVVAATAMCLTLAFVRYAQGHGILDAALSAVTLGVAALPEEFPVAFTFFLGVGVFRLARRQALVRRAVSVENIGRVTCICADKTGTITEGRLRVAEWIPAPGILDRRLIRVAAAASRRETGDPLDGAILDAADAEHAVTTGDVLATFPFTEDRRRETAVVREDSHLLVATKGAPEIVLALTDLGPAGRTQWSERVRGLAAGGHKVIACASRSLAAGEWTGEEPTLGYGFAGLVVCEDGVRDGVAEAVARCREGGIHTIMVTGDHPSTALAVAREVGLGAGHPRAILGEELGEWLRESAGDLRDVDVIARAMPSQKLELVRALQSRGEIVAVTGDGVNDVPALQAADVGIAMGERGTRSAREVASIVLLDDNFRSIVDAIAEGRQVFRNLQLSYQYLLIVHICLVLTATLIPLAGYPLLYLPIHIVWLETIIHPTAMLVFQESSSGRHLTRAEARRPARFFKRGEWALILASGLLLTAVVVFGYDRSLGRGGVEHARAMALAVLTLASAALAATLSRLRTATARVISGATVAVSAVVIQVPTLAALVHVSPLHLDDWAIAMVGAAAAVSLPMALGVAQHRRPVHPAEPVSPRVAPGLEGEGGHLADHHDSLALKCILCATDFSDSAAAALEFAVGLARPRHTELRIVHVRPAAAPSGRPMACLTHRSEGDEKSLADLIEDLDRYGQPASDAGVTTRAVVRQGDPADEIVREAKHASAELVVMGRHSQVKSNPWILGSVAERVLRQASCPVVVVRPFPRPGPASPRHVLCALDLGETAAATLEYAAGVADAITADLIVVHVETEGHVEAARRLDALVSRGCAPKAGIRTLLMTGVPHLEILAAAHENGACVVVVGSHGGGIVDRPFLGSTTLHLLRQSECPVLVVPADVAQPGVVTHEASVVPVCGRRP